MLTFNTMKNLLLVVALLSFVCGQGPAAESEQNVTATLPSSQPQAVPEQNTAVNTSLPTPEPEPQPQPQPGPERNAAATLPFTSPSPQPEQAVESSSVDVPVPSSEPETLPFFQSFFADLPELPPRDENGAFAAMDAYIQEKLSQNYGEADPGLQSFFELIFDLSTPEMEALVAQQDGNAAFKLKGNPSTFFGVVFAVIVTSLFLLLNH